VPETDAKKILFSPFQFHSILLRKIFWNWNIYSRIKIMVTKVYLRCADGSFKNNLNPSELIPIYSINFGIKYYKIFIPKPLEIPDLGYII
jgi:hypothetical protein